MLQNENWCYSQRYRVSSESIGRCSSLTLNIFLPHKSNMFVWNMFIFEFSIQFDLAIFQWNQFPISRGLKAHPKSDRSLARERRQSRERRMFSAKSALYHLVQNNNNFTVWWSWIDAKYIEFIGLNRWLDWSHGESFWNICSSRILLLIDWDNSTRQRKMWRIWFVRSLSGRLHMFNDLLNDSNCHISLAIRKKPASAKSDMN